MADNEYIVQALGRIEERQIKNSEGIAAINATMAHVVNDNVACKADHESHDERLSDVESTQRIQKGIIAAAIAAIPFASFAMEYFKK